jgi:hypothetical protein
LLFLPCALSIILFCDLFVRLFYFQCPFVLTVDAHSAIMFLLWVGQWHGTSFSVVGSLVSTPTGVHATLKFLVLADAITRSILPKKKPLLRSTPSSASTTTLAFSMRHSNRGKHKVEPASPARMLSSARW